MSSEYDETIARGAWVCEGCGSLWHAYPPAFTRHSRIDYREEGQAETDGPEGGEPRYALHSVFGRYVDSWAVSCGPIVHHRLIADEASE